jgi:quercetin dioxygenase-like cupin family protein
MRPFVSLVSVVAVALIGLGMLGGRSRVGAQETTPTLATSTPEAITVNAQAFAPVTALPASGVLGVLRVTLASDAVLPADPSDPSTALILVEAGTLTVRVDAPIAVIRAGAEFAPGNPIPQESVGAGTEVMLGPGDAFVSPPHVSGQIRNPGASAVVLLLAVAFPHDDTEQAGTPTP